jgi:hypothetical protein
MQIHFLHVSKQSINSFLLLFEPLLVNGKKVGILMRKGENIHSTFSSMSMILSVNLATMLAVAPNWMTPNSAFSLILAASPWHSCFPFMKSAALMDPDPSTAYYAKITKELVLNANNNHPALYNTFVEHDCSHTQLILDAGLSSFGTINTTVYTRYLRRARVEGERERERVEWRRGGRF